MLQFVTSNCRKYCNFCSRNSERAAQRTVFAAMADCANTRPRRRYSQPLRSRRRCRIRCAAQGPVRRCLDAASAGCAEGQARHGDSEPRRTTTCQPMPACGQSFLLMRSSSIGLTLADITHQYSEHASSADQNERCAVLIANGQVNERRQADSGGSDESTIDLECPNCHKADHPVNRYRTRSHVIHLLHRTIMHISISLRLTNVRIGPLGHCASVVEPVVKSKTDNVRISICAHDDRAWMVTGQRHPIQGE
jgi:hypothetical protein